MSLHVLCFYIVFHDFLSAFMMFRSFIINPHVVSLVLVLQHAYSHHFISSIICMIFDNFHDFLSIFIIFIVSMSFIDFSPHFSIFHPVPLFSMTYYRFPCNVPCFIIIFHHFCFFKQFHHCSLSAFLLSSFTLFSLIIHMIFRHDSSFSCF